MGAELVIEEFLFVENEKEIGIVFNKEKVSRENQFYIYAELVSKDEKKLIIPDISLKMLNSIKRKQSLLLIESDDDGNPVDIKSFDYIKINRVGV